MKNGVALVVSLMLGVLGFAAMYVIMSRQSDPALKEREPVAMTRIVVAAGDIRPNTPVTRADLATRDLPTEFVSGANIEESQAKTLLGRTLRNAVKKGEPILLPSVQFENSSAPREIESMLGGENRLAIAIEVDAAQSVAGLIRPGQRVDVIGTFDLKVRYLVGNGTGDDDTVTKTVMLMQNRTVLAVDTITRSRYKGDPKTTKNHVVTIAVTAEEALKIASLQSKGEAHLALRSSHDQRVHDVESLGPEHLLKLNGAVGAKKRN